MNDEELMRLLLRTGALVRRSQHHSGEEHDPHGPRGPHEPRDQHDKSGPHAGRRHHPGHPGPPPPPAHRGRARVLAMLAVKEGQSQKDLAYLLGIRPQSLSEIILKLEEEGAVERRKSPEDGRVLNVYLTEKGRERAARASENRKRVAQDALSALSDDEKQQLGTILTKLAASLEEE